MLWTFCPHLPSLAGDFITLPGNELSISILCFTYHQQLYKNPFPTAALVCGGWNNWRPVDVEILIRTRARSVGLLRIMDSDRLTDKSQEPSVRPGTVFQSKAFHYTLAGMRSILSALCYCQLRCDDCFWSETALTVDWWSGSGRWWLWWGARNHEGVTNDLTHLCIKWNSMETG